MVKVDNYGIPYTPEAFTSVYAPIPTGLDYIRWDGVVWVSDKSVYDMRDAFLAEQRRICIVAQRAEAYRNEADPLFFQAQRGDATQQQWLDKVAEIKQRYPYV